jgi:hypothetical protein
LGSAQYSAAVALFRAGFTALLVSFSINVAPAWASDGGAAFELPEACGTEHEFRVELERLAGVHAAQAYPLKLAISASAAGNYRLFLDMRGEVRELEHTDCRTLFRSAVVIAAASVKPASEPARAQQKDPLPRPEATPVRPKLDESILRGGAAVGTGVAFGVLPGAAAVFELRGSLESRFWGISLSGKFLPEKHASEEGRGVDVTAVGGRIAGVVRPIDPLLLSAGMDAEWLEGVGDAGVSDRQTDSAWALAPSLELAFIPFEIQHLRFEVAAQGRVALLRPRFVVTGFRDLYQVPIFGGAGLVRGTFLFP